MPKYKKKIMEPHKKYKCHMCSNWFLGKDLTSFFNIDRLCPNCLKFCKNEQEQEDDFFRKIDELREPNTSEERKAEIFKEFTGD
jgi:hypothetical protein